jgi:hypothetical protein
VKICVPAGRGGLASNIKKPLIVSGEFRIAQMEQRRGNVPQHRWGAATAWQGYETIVVAEAEGPGGEARICLLYDVAAYSIFIKFVVIFSRYLLYGLYHENRTYTYYEKFHAFHKTVI